MIIIKVKFRGNKTFTVIRGTTQFENTVIIFIKQFSKITFFRSLKQIFLLKF